MTRITDSKRRSPRAPHGKPQAPVKRSACEQCRNRKLGCTRNKASCERCIAEGLPCHFENRLRMGRPCKARPLTPTTPPSVSQTSHSYLLHTPVKRESAPRDSPPIWKPEEFIERSLPLSPAESQQGEPVTMAGRMPHTIVSSPPVSCYEVNMPPCFFPPNVSPSGHMGMGHPVSSQYLMLPGYSIATAPVDQRASSSFSEDHSSQRGCSCTERIAEPAMYRLLKAKREGTGLEEAWRGVASDLAELRTCPVCLLDDDGRGSLELQWLTNKEREWEVAVGFGV